MRSATTGSTGGTGTPDVHDRRVGRWYDDKKAWREFRATLEGGAR